MTTAEAGFRRGWWQRRNFLDVRNGELVVILILALLMGVAATFATAYLGVR